MLNKIRIKNFKCLKDTGYILIKPLTFFVGPNSSGKSSIKQFLSMLKQTVNSSNLSPLNTKPDLIDLGTYSDFIFRKNLNNQLSFEFEYDIKFESKLAKEFKTEPVTKVFFEATFYCDKKTLQVKLKEYKNSIKNCYEHVKLNTKSMKYIAEVGYLDERDNKFTKTKIGVRSLKKFYDFFPSIPTITKKKREKLISNKKAPLLTILPTSLENILKELFFFGPLREFPQRYYITKGETAEDVGLKGEKAVDILWYSKISKQPNDLMKKLQYWLKELNIARSVKLNTLLKGYMYSLNLKDTKLQTSVNISDVGFGASQVLPMIIECFFARRWSTLFFEQPEIHLHPRAQSILGDLFIRSIQDGPKRIIIETHSEHILSRIRRRIAEDKLKKEDVAIYYFEPTTQGSNISEVIINDFGQYEQSPEGFWEEGFDESYEIMKNVSKRREK